MLQGVELSDVGFVQDYRDLDEIKQWLDLSFDHKDLNEVLGKSINPTAENIALTIFRAHKANFPLLQSVGVSETPKTMAWYIDD